MFSSQSSKRSGGPKVSSGPWFSTASSEVWDVSSLSVWGSLCQLLVQAVWEILLVVLLWTVLFFLPQSQKKEPKWATSLCRGEEQEIWLHFLLYEALPPSFQIICSSVTFSRGRGLGFALDRTPCRTKMQLLVLSSHLLWHYSPSSPTHSCYVLFHFNACTQQKQRSVRINSTVCAFTFTMALWDFPGIPEKHSILEEQKTALMLLKIRQHGITSTL